MSHVFSLPDSLLAHCMQNILVALGSEDIEKLLKECAQSGFEASALAEQEAIGKQLATWTSVHIVSQKLLFIPASVIFLIQCN